MQCFIANLVIFWVCEQKYPFCNIYICCEFSHKAFLCVLEVFIKYSYAHFNVQTDLQFSWNLKLWKRVYYGHYKILLNKNLQKSFTQLVCYKNMIKVWKHIKIIPSVGRAPQHNSFIKHKQIRYQNKLLMKYRAFTIAYLIHRKDADFSYPTYYNKTLSHLLILNKNYWRIKFVLCVCSDNNQRNEPSLNCPSTK